MGLSWHTGALACGAREEERLCKKTGLRIDPFQRSRRTAPRHDCLLRRNASHPNPCLTLRLPSWRAP